MKKLITLAVLASALSIPAYASPDGLSNLQIGDLECSAYAASVKSNDQLQYFILYWVMGGIRMRSEPYGRIKVQFLSNAAVTVMLQHYCQPNPTTLISAVARAIISDLEN